MTLFDLLLGPAGLHRGVDLLEVVVQTGGPVLLDHEPVAARRIRRPLRLRRLAEIALALIFGERSRHRSQFARMIRWHQSLRMPSCGWTLGPSEACSNTAGSCI